MCLITQHAMNVYGTVEVQLHVFWTSALNGDEWSVSRPDRFTLENISPRNSMDRRLSGRQGLSGRCGEEKNSLLLPLIEPW